MEQEMWKWEQMRALVSEAEIEKKGRSDILSGGISSVTTNIFLFFRLKEKFTVFPSLS